jgi:hypothetical protein
MDILEQRELDAIAAYCDEIIESTADVTVTVYPPQKTPAWARTPTAVARGTRIGPGHYVRRGCAEAA